MKKRIESGKAEHKPARYLQLDVWNKNKTPKMSKKKMCIHLITKKN